jgi:cytochrome c-type biogenesis protein
LGNVTIAFAFTAGILSFLSPCVFPLLPAYVANLADSTIENNRIVVSRRILIIKSLGFILGFSIIFVAMGATASAVGQFFSLYKDIIVKVSGFLVIVFGMQMAEILKLDFLSFTKRKEVKTGSKNIFRPMLLGISFGIGWTPCVSLALSSILLLAGSSSTIYKGMLMLFVYSLGLGIPFLIITFLITYSLNVMKKINRFLNVLSKANGWILIILGVLLFTNQLQRISAWLAGLTL